MLAVLLALVSAAGYGASDFTAGLAARKASVLLVTFVGAACSLVLTLLVLPVTASDAPTAAALGWGAASGLGGMAGALALYAGFRHAAFSVAGPLSAVSAAGLSVIAGVLFGERPSPLSLAGIGVALPAILLVSLTAATPGQGKSDTSEKHRPAWAGVGWGLAAGTGFAVLFIGLDRAGSAAGIWPVFSGQVIEVLVMALLVAVTRGRRRGLTARGTTPSTVVLAVLTGITGGAATIVYFIATHHGFLAITAVLTSLYPAVTIGLARLLAGERLSSVRLAGLILAGASVTLIALGGSS